MKDSFIDSIADRIRIVELINRFGMAIDLRDWKKFRSLFAEGVEFDYSSTWRLHMVGKPDRASPSIGEVAGTLPAEDIVNTASKDLGGFQATQHVITNHLVEIEDNTATCYAHVRAMHFLPNEEKESLLEMGGYYTAGLILTDSEWKIKSWKFTVLWSRGDLQLFNLAKENRA